MEASLLVIVLLLQMFEILSQKDCQIVSVLLNMYSKCGKYDRVLEIYDYAISQQIELNNVCFVTLLTTFAESQDLQKGLEIHAKLLEFCEIGSLQDLAKE